MSELEDLRTQNKELKKLLENALDLLEKSKQALKGQGQPSPAASRKKRGIARSRSISVPGNVPKKKKRRN
jgi:hypothetical protein